MTKNPLTTTHPKIAKDWDCKKNGSLLPEHFRFSSKEKVWWCCVEGHKYQVSIYSRTRSGGCKVCLQPTHTEKARLAKLKKSCSFALAKPHLIPEWDVERNKGFSPHQLSFKSHKLIWWKCKHGHRWQSNPHRRSRGDGCPTCSKNNAGTRARKWRLKKSGRSFAEAYPELLKEWDYKKNTLQPSELSPKSNYRASWFCQYGHEWEATIDNRGHNGSNCPQCKPQTSRIEIYLLCELRAIFNEVKWRFKIDGVECDLYIPDLQLGIEVDGEYWHRNKVKQDLKKTQFLTRKGIYLIRVRDERLPLINGAAIGFRSSDDPQQIMLRLAREVNINFASSKLDAYIAKEVQQNTFEYKEMIARLPAPPPGETLLDLYPEVALEWNYKTNLPLTPELFTAGSMQKVAWLCSKGHQ